MYQTQLYRTNSFPPGEFVLYFFISYIPAQKWK